MTTTRLLLALAPILLALAWLAFLRWIVGRAIDAARTLTEDDDDGWGWIR